MVLVNRKEKLSFYIVITKHSGLGRRLHFILTKHSGLGRRLHFIRTEHSGLGRRLHFILIENKGFSRDFILTSTFSFKGLHGLHNRFS